MTTKKQGTKLREYIKHQNPKIELQRIQDSYLNGLRFIGLKGGT